MRDAIKGRRGLVYIVSLSAAVLLCALLVRQSIFHGDEPQYEPKAAIVDGLMHFSNPEFVEEATELLRDAGYHVDYVEGEEVTVDFYRRLPSLGYSLIVLRVHCGPLYRYLDDGTRIPEGTVLFTTETYDQKKYFNYQERGLVAIARITARPDELYFAVPTWFFDKCAEGEMQNATVVLDSCYGFYADMPLMMAKAFMGLGAKVFIGWDGEVQAEHTDSAVLTLLRALCEDDLTVEEAVERAMEEVGPDPHYRSVMQFHPTDVGTYRLNIPGKG